MLIIVRGIISTIIISISVLHVVTFSDHLVPLARTSCAQSASLYKVCVVLRSNVHGKSVLSVEGASALV